MRRTFGLVAISMLCVVIFGCTAFSPIVGKWYDVKTRDTVEFTRWGDVVFKSSGFVTTGRYELVGNDIVKLDLEGIGAMIVIFGGDAWEYKISGDTMTVKVAGQRIVYKRIQTTNAN